MRREKLKERPKGAQRQAGRGGEEDAAPPGRKKLGPYREATQTRIAALRDLNRLNDLLDRNLDVSTWDELVPRLPHQNEPASEVERGLTYRNARLNWRRAAWLGRGGSG